MVDNFVRVDIHDECMGNAHKRIDFLDDRINTMALRQSEMIESSARTQALLEQTVQLQQDGIKWMQNELTAQRKNDHNTQKAYVKYGGWILAACMFVLAGLKFGGII